MCSAGLFGGGAPKSPVIPEPKTYETTKDTTASVTKARSTQKDKAAAALGQMGSIATSPFGVSSTASTSNGSLLGAK